MTSPFSRALVSAVLAGLLAVALCPGRALADDTTRISQLESEIQRLRIQLNEQNRRIQRLEAELEARSGGALIGTIPGRHAQEAAQGSKERQPWLAPEAWERVAQGMTQAEVTAILGEPTAIESVDALQTLFYRGAAGAGTLSGLVNLRDGRVVAVRKPAFAAD